MKTDVKTDYNFINPETIEQSIMLCADDLIINLGYDINDPKARRYLSHNEFNYVLRGIYQNIFKPSQSLCNNQKSLIDYDNISQLNAVVNAFITLCAKYNKSVGLMSFSFMTGITTETMLQWRNEEKLNPSRSAVIKYIQEGHKALHIGLLNESPVGALAVANNDVETGLEWSKQQAEISKNNTIFILPSERLSRLNLEKNEEPGE